jgi:hypothetical protein
MQFFCSDRMKILGFALMHRNEFWEMFEVHVNRNGLLGITSCQKSTGFMTFIFIIFKPFTPVLRLWTPVTFCACE